MQNTVVEKPKNRSKLRKRLGKEYFIIKRKIKWLGQRFAKEHNSNSLPYCWIKHQSMLLRPLKNVDMYLQHNKVTNLRLAIAHINGVVIKPGETFSIWQSVGRTSARKGYLEGLILENGKIGKGIGGGLCQLGNLLYWMALHTPITITERWRHSYDVFPDVNRTIPFACGATLSYNYIDLQLKNETDVDLQINLWLDDTHLHGEIRTNQPVKKQYKVIETDHIIQSQWWGGYTRHNRIWRHSSDLDNPTEITEELIAENHAIMMYNPMIESAKK